MIDDVYLHLSNLEEHINTFIDSDLLSSVRRYFNEEINLKR